MEENLLRTLLKSDSENNIKSTVLNCLQNPTQGEELVDSLNTLVRQDGKTACKVILELLMHHDFGYEEAERFWQDIVDHHRLMSASLGRPVGLSVAVCDYFSLHGKGVSFPKLIDVHEFEAMHNERYHDFLTGLHNRQSLEMALSMEFGRAERYQRKFSVLFLDLDAFKKINDIHGHLAGDRILQHVGRILLQSKRSVDIAARFGGDEFVLLLPDTDKKEALQLAERIRAEVCGEIFVVDNETVSLTVSGGVATYPDDAQSAKGVCKCADETLYQAKHFGKNIVLAHASEKRRSTRVDFLAPLTITQIDGVPCTRVSTQSKNLGSNGILLESNLPINKGSLLQMEITLGDTILNIPGKVVRLEKLGQKRFDIAVSFLMNQEKDFVRIREFLQ